VCSYDRAGTGFSDPSPHPSSSEYVLQDLHELLRQAGIPMPIVLVGHSDGGLYSSMYASRWPDDVAGMVLIDPFQVGEEESAERVLTPTQLKAWLADDQQDIAQARKCLTLAQSGALRRQPQMHHGCLDDPANPDPVLHRVLDAQMARPSEAAANLSQMLDTYPPIEGGMSPAEKLAIQMPLKMGNKPLIVLDASHEQFAFGADQQDRLLLAMWQAQDAAIATSTRGRRIIVDGSGHYIHQEKPERVVQAIHDVIDEVRCRPHIDCAAGATTAK
jgi:pimeloyl-ACP methyl ester carboxylesterase